jgi:hypothetical protein
MSDPNFANVGLLLHCNGTDGSTSFPDSSSNAHTVTALANAQVDTGQKKYGSASAQFDGTDDKLTVPYASAFNLATGDFTIECWVRFQQDADAWSGSWLLAQPGNSSFDQWSLWADSPGGTSYQAVFQAVNTADSQVIALTHGAALVKNVWYHLAVTRSGSTFRLFVDGASPVSGSSSATLKSTAAALTIGNDADGTAGHYGWIDDIRITKGVARYTAAFTPPVAEFEEGGLSARLAADSMLGAVSLLGSAGRFNARLSDASLLGQPAVRAFHDWTGRLAALITERHVMDLSTPGGLVRVPISSWQATLQTGGACFASCVIPACGVWIDTLALATAFSVKRIAVLSSGEKIEVEVAAAPLQTLQIDQGPTNHTASLSGYGDAVPAVDNPSAVYDRTLAGLRSISTYSSGARVRCKMDWLLRPAMRALYADTSMVVAYINYTATLTSGGVEAYMDVGERSA